MVDTVDINTYVKKLTEEFKPERVVLFGSYARGTANEDSDVDLLVIMSHKGRNVDQALTIRKRINRSFPLDLIVKTPVETRQRLKMKDSFITTILEDGKVLYDKARHFRVDR
jgi:predicted nucleotidyltransferase